MAGNSLTSYFHLKYNPTMPLVLKCKQGHTVPARHVECIK